MKALKCSVLAFAPHIFLGIILVEGRSLASATLFAKAIQANFPEVNSSKKHLTRQQLLERSNIQDTSNTQIETKEDELSYMQEQGLHILLKRIISTALSECFLSFNYDPYIKNIQTTMNIMAGLSNPKQVQYRNFHI